MSNRLIGYFDLNAQRRELAPRPTRQTSSALPQWMALLLGIFIQPYMAAYRVTGSWNFTGAWSWLLFSALVGVIIFPTVYRGAFDRTKPWLVLVAPSFTAGLGWQSLFSTATKLAGH